jgi:alpha-methylacyl-CoA racemase
MTSGPLAGRRVLEIGGIGPTPHAAMLLADLGAEVVRVERPGTDLTQVDHMLRGRVRVCADLKEPTEHAQLLDLVRSCDVLVEGFRPGVMERLGLGPQDCQRVNPRLVYGRMTGYGQRGPRAQQAGHDINFLSLTGVLHALGPADRTPMSPLNLLGDFGGGSAFLVIGVLAALLEVERTGQGQVIDAAVVDGATALAQMIWSWRSTGEWFDRREDNLLDGGAPFYRTYRCADGAFLAVGCLEPEFYRQFVQGLGLDLTELPSRDDRSNWPHLERVFAARISEKPRDEWGTHFFGTDACVTPVVDFAEAVGEEHIRARNTVVKSAGVDQAAPAPRFSGFVGAVPETARAVADLGQVQRLWSEPAQSDHHVPVRAGGAEK